MVGVCGPSILGLILHNRYTEREQRGELWRSLIDFRRLSVAWWVILLFGYPLMVLLACLLSLWSGYGLPGQAILNQIIQSPLLLIPILLQFILVGPLAEELGWRGFALPRMLQRWGPICANLILSLLWWVWHLPLFFFVGSTYYKFGWFTLEFWLFLVTIFPLGLLIGFSYSFNRKSLLAAVTLHFIYNLTMNLMAPTPINIRLTLSILLWLLLAFVFVMKRIDVSSQVGERNEI